MSRSVTKQERAAITALERLARRWPQSLKLFSAAGSLCVIPADAPMEEHAGGFDDIVLATIQGIPNDGGDPG